MSLYSLLGSNEGKSAGCGHVWVGVQQCCSETRGEGLTGWVGSKDVPNSPALCAASPPASGRAMVSPPLVKRRGRGGEGREANLCEESGFNFVAASHQANGDPEQKNRAVSSATRRRRGETTTVQQDSQTPTATSVVALIILVLS